MLILLGGYLFPVREHVLMLPVCVMKKSMWIALDRLVFNLLWSPQSIVLVMSLFRVTAPWFLFRLFCLVWLLRIEIMWLVTSLPYQLTCGLLLPPAHSFIKFGPFWCALSITWSCNAEILSRQGCKLYCLSWSVLPQLGILTREWKRVLEEVTYQFLAWTLFFWAQDAQI